MLPIKKQIKFKLYKYPKNLSLNVLEKIIIGKRTNILIRVENKIEMYKNIVAKIEW